MTPASSAALACLLAALDAPHAATVQPPAAPTPAPAAQPQPPAPAFSVADAWATIRAAYASTPTAERITVTLASDAAPKEAESFECRLDPRDTNPAGPRLRLDLGPIRLVAADARLVALHALSREGAFIADLPPGTLTPASLASVVPPLPLPALAALARADAAAAGYVQPVEWTGVDRLPTGAFTIRGRSNALDVTLAAARSGRIRSLAITGLPDAGSITVTFTELAPPQPGDFDLAADAIPRVASVRDLFALPPTPFDCGQPLPELAVTAADGAPVLLRDALATVPPATGGAPDRAAVEEAPPDAQRIILVLHHLPIDPAACDTPSADLAAARAGAALVLARAERDRFLARAGPAPAAGPDRLPPVSAGIVLVADLADGSAPQRIDRAARAIASAKIPTPGARHPPRVFGATSAARTLGLFQRDVAPGQTVVVTVTADWRLLSVDPWPPGLTAADGAALLGSRLRAPLPNPAPSPAPSP